MEKWAPVIETGLGVGLVVWLALRYHKPIHGILAALQKRIESGSAVKAGPIEPVVQSDGDVLPASASISDYTNDPLSNLQVQVFSLDALRLQFGLEKDDG